MSRKELLFTKVKSLVGMTSFTNNENHMLYSVHKMFDVIEEHKLASTGDYIVVSEDIYKLKVMRVLPPVINLEHFFKENSLVWSQEYKQHYKIVCVVEENILTLKIKIDRITKPAVIFIKELKQLDCI